MRISHITYCNGCNKCCWLLSNRKKEWRPRAFLLDRPATVTTPKTSIVTVDIRRAMSFICLLQKQKQFIIYTAHFMSGYVPKSRFSAKKGVHCSGALLKNEKHFSLNFLTVRGNDVFGPFLSSDQCTHPP